MVTPVRIAVVGLGNFGRIHALTVTKVAEAELVGLVDEQAQTAAAAREIWPQVPVWTDFESAVSQCDCDAWIVASSTASHVPLVRELLKAGRKVLVEKPLAQNLAEAKSLAPLVLPDSRNLMLGHVVLFNSEFQQLGSEARERGSIVFIDCVRHRPVGTLTHYPNESPFHLTMVHDLYCVLALMERREPSRFTAQVHRTQAGGPDLALAQLQWDNGAVASLTASFLTPDGIASDGFDRLELFGNGWAARIQPNPRPLEIWDDRARWPMGLEIQIGPNGCSGMLAEQLRCFCRVVRNQQPVPIGATYADAIQVQHWLDQLETAAGIH